jgi:hypothetical protein
MATWTDDKITQYHVYAKTYIESYNQRIDCADLALATLIDFAGLHALPVRLKYYAGGWKWKAFDPTSGNSATFKGEVQVMMGALNVIDNTVSINIDTAKAGDLIMSKWSNSLGHTRIIHSVTRVESTGQYQVVWYQGNLPPVVPEKKEDIFSAITGVYGDSPRRWKFGQFNQ